VAKTTKKPNGFTLERPQSLIKKCIHTFRCIFYPGGKDCERLAKEELSTMTKTQLEELGRLKGIELDKRKTKAKLVEQLYNEL
jgi:hypothetical protein